MYLYKKIYFPPRGEYVFFYLGKRGMMDSNLLHHADKQEFMETSYEEEEL
jgi:hypothetical protein